MTGVRVHNIPKEVKEKWLKIHFSKPEHGGGKIRKIYFPLFHNDAVILFEKKKVVDTILSVEHDYGEHTLDVQSLPEHVIFTELDGKLDMDASVLIQATQSLRDEMEFGENIRITEEEDGTYRIHGSWFQLEWAWHYIDCFMQQQEIIQHEISQQPQHYAGTPKEIDSSEYLGRSASPGLSGTSPLTAHGRSHASTNRHMTESSGLLVDHHTDKDRQQTAHSKHEDRNRNRRADTRKDEELSSRLLSPLENMSSSLENMSSLKKHIKTSYSSSTGLGYRADDEEDETYLQGTGYKVPNDTLHSMQAQGVGRSDDQNNTFQQFSGLSSLHDPSSIRSSKARTESPDCSYDHKRQGQSEEVKHSVRGGDTESVASVHSMSGRGSPTGSVDRDVTPRMHEISDTTGPSGRAVSPHITVKPSAMSMELPDRYSEDQLLSTFNINNMRVTLYFGNLLIEETDAIVNAANERLEHYGGIAYAILKARGREMESECKRYIEQHGHLATTEVIHTSGAGGSITASHILHAAGPMWLGERFREKFSAQLVQTFLNCLSYANDRLWIRSLALPVISSGVYGAPLDTCVRCFLDAVLIFTSNNPDARLNDVRLVNNDAESTVTSIVLFQTLLETGISRLTADAHQVLNSSQNASSSTPGELNLPRGRRDNSSSFSRTVSAHRDDQSVLDSLKSSWTSSAAPRRSSSLSRASRKPSSVTDDKYGDKYSTKTDRNSSKMASTLMDLGRPGDKTRETPDRLSRKASTEYDRTYTAGATASGYSLFDDEGCTRVDHHNSIGSSHAKSVPKMKQSLMSPDPTRMKTSTSGSRTGDKYGSSGLSKKLSPRYERSVSYSHDRADDEYGLHSLPAHLNSTSHREQFLQPTNQKKEICAICLDQVKNPKELKCKHKFCTSCLQQHFSKSKPTCPTCGAVYGRIVGDQPTGGMMTYITDRTKTLPGYETSPGVIIITYTFPDGQQDSNHPHPGRSYRGLTRTAYLPNTTDGREVLHLLKKAFDARLVFTIGESRSSGKAGVLTWNDIHHKTNMTGGPTRFGYPDSCYLQRVRGELADKGITSSK